MNAAQSAADRARRSSVAGGGLEARSSDLARPIEDDLAELDLKPELADAGLSDDRDERALARVERDVVRRPTAVELELSFGLSVRPEKQRDRGLGAVFG